MQNFNGEKIIKKNDIKKVVIPEKREYRNEVEKRTKKTWVKVFKFGFISLLILGFLGYAHIYFHSATFEVKPEEKEIVLNNDIFKAVRDAKDGDDKSITFKLWTTEKVIKKELVTNMIEDVKKQATGKIKIINNTNKAQKLRKETRFETEDGKIYKIVKSITVPPKSSVVRDAFADKPGSQYNLKAGVKLTVPGFKEAKNNLLYKNITGEVAEEFKGGFIGKKPVPDEKDYLDKKAEIEKEVDDKLFEWVLNKIPKTYILDNDAIFKDISFKTSFENGKAYLVAKVKIYTIVFDRNDFLSLVSEFSKTKINDFKITSTAFLKFKTLNKDKIRNIPELKEFQFKLNGSVKYSKELNIKEFKNDVKGLNEEDLKALLKEKYLDDFKIDYSFTPFWRNSVPTNLNKIYVEIEKKS